MKKVFIVTGAQQGAEVNTQFLNGLHKIAEEKGGTLRVLPLRGVSNHGRFIEVLKEEIAMINENIESDEAFEEITKFYKLSVYSFRRQHEVIHIQKTDKTHTIEYTDENDAVEKMANAYTRMIAKIYEADEKEKVKENKLTGDEKATIRAVERLVERLAKKEDELENLYPLEIRPFIVSANTVEDFNNNVGLNSTQISPTATKPLQGMHELALKTTIFGSPQIQLEVVHTSNNKMARLMMTTGACTHPFYSKSRVGSIAEHHHTYGAILVEVVNDEEFHIRQLVANKKGEIVDLGVKYTSNQTKRQGIEALVLGDVHVMFLNPKVDQATEEMITELEPKEVIIHDIFDAFSISHWHQNDIILQAQKALQMLDHNGVKMHDKLEEELEQCAEYLYNKTKKFPKVKFVIVASNHDEAIDRCLREGRFIKDPKNSVVGAKLFIDAVNGWSPLESWCKNHSKFKDSLQNIRFLSRNDDYKIEGIQCANHGDSGLGGSFGSVASEARGEGASVIGHSHTPKILHKVYQVGTSTFLKLSYNRGFSNWMNTMCLINKGGTRQLINVINGKWRA